MSQINKDLLALVDDLTRMVERRKAWATPEASILMFVQSRTEVVVRSIREGYAMSNDKALERMTLIHQAGVIVQGFYETEALAA